MIEPRKNFRSSQLLSRTKPEKGWPVQTSQKAGELSKCNLLVVISSSSLGLIAGAIGECMLMVLTSMDRPKEDPHSLFRNAIEPEHASHFFYHIGEELSRIVYLVSCSDGMRGPDMDSDVDRKLPQRRLRVSR